MKEIKISVENLNLFYNDKQALKDISLNILSKKVTAFIGPSGCGKSTFLRVLNRMNDLIDNVKIEGKVLIDDINIYDGNLDVVNLRKRVGMVFQKSNLFPKTVFENIIFGPRLMGINDKKKLIVTKICEKKRKNRKKISEDL